MLLVWQLVILIVLSLNVGASPAPPVVSCENALNAFQLTISPDGVKTESYFATGKGDLPTVQVEGELAGRHGGKLLRLHRTGARWISDYRSVNFDPQGDPRWFIELLGTEAAEFFGFKILADDQMLVPDEAEFNGAIQAVNSKLGANPIAVSYYSTGTNANTNLKTYVQNFRDSGGLPIAAGGNHLIHDLSFHSGAIFLPPSLVHLKKSTEAYLEEFIAYLEAKHADPAHVAAIKYYAYLWRYHETKTIDNGTGLVNAGIVGYLRDSQTSDGSQHLRHAINYMGNYGLSPKDHFEKLITALLEKDTKRSIYKGYFNPAKLEKALAALDTQTLKQDLKAFHKKYDPAGLLSEQPFWGLGGRIDKNEFCIEITTRRTQIREAAMSLIKHTAGN